MCGVYICVVRRRGSLDMCLDFFEYEVDVEEWVVNFCVLFEEKWLSWMVLLGIFVGWRVNRNRICAMHRILECRMVTINGWHEFEPPN